jgi:hypothetical protein
MHSIRSESINKKQDFNNQLRKPVNMPVKLPMKPTSKDESKPLQESYLEEKDVLNTNYLASA